MAMFDVYVTQDPPMVEVVNNYGFRAAHERKPQGWGARPDGGVDFSAWDAVLASMGYRRATGWDAVPSGAYTVVLPAA